MSAFFITELTSEQMTTQANQTGVVPSYASEYQTEQPQNSVGPACTRGSLPEELLNRQKGGVQYKNTSTECIGYEEKMYRTKILIKVVIIVKVFVGLNNLMDCYISLYRVSSRSGDSNSDGSFSKLD